MLHGLWNVAKQRMLEDRRASPEEEGDSIREDKAMQEENFLSSSQREDTEGKDTEKKHVRRKSEEKETKSRKKVVEEEMGRLAVNCKRVSFECRSCLGGNFFRGDWSKCREMRVRVSVCVK